MSRLTHPDPAPPASAEVPPGTLTQVQEELLLLLNGGESAPPPRAAVVEPPAPPPSAVPASSPSVPSPDAAAQGKAARPRASGGAAAQEPEAKAEGCPSCGFTGSWGMGSWCPECGYFPRVGRQGDVVEAAVPEEELPPTPWSLVPGWVWSLVGGMAAILIVSGCMPLFLRDPLHRGASAVLQLGIGILVGIFSQVRAFLYAMKTHEQFKFYSIVTSPLAIWKGPIKLLPQTRPLFFCAAWGWTAALAATLFIGVHWPVLLKSFQDYMAGVRKAEALQMAPGQGEEEGEGEKKNEEKRPGEMTFGEFIGEIGKTLTPEEEKPKMKFKVKKEKSKEDIDELMEDLVSEVPVDMKDSGAEEGSTDDALKKAGDAAKEAGDAAREAGEGKEGEPGDAADPADEEPAGQRCLIIGYTANASGEIRSLLVAVPLKDGRLRFAAKLPLDALTNRDLAELRKVMAKIRTKNPATACPYGGVWVRPVLQCRVEHEGWTSDGRLRSPRVEELVIERTDIRERSASRTPTLR